MSGPDPADAASPDPGDPRDPQAEPDPTDAASPDPGDALGDPTDPPTEPPRGDGVFEPCTMDEGCQDGLRCYAAGGFCAPACERDDDCAPIDGFEYGCSDTFGACRIDCSPQGSGGECPAGFACWLGRCTPPLQPGAGLRTLLQPCDIALGDSDCMPGLICYRWDDTRHDGPGYCTLPCERGNGEGQGNRGNGGRACEVPFGEPFDFSCGSEGGCRFNCSDSPCPQFMECEERSDQGGRCYYPRGTTP